MNESSKRKKFRKAKGNPNKDCCYIYFYHYVCETMRVIFIITILLVLGCDRKEVVPSESISFEGAQKVTITSYSDHAMEPFFSRDGTILMFNNSNAADNTNLHWATRVNDSTFQYQGEIAGVNSESLEGVPTMDTHGKFYFVSTSNYVQTLESLYQGDFNNGTVTNVIPVANVSLYQNGWLNFDVEVNADGETLYFVDGRFDESGGPYEADLVIAQKVSGEFQRLSNSDQLLANINTDELEYAACISANNLELYFTRVVTPITTSSQPEIWVATRSAIHDPFRAPEKIENITGFVEAATLSPDGEILYYHKLGTDDKFSLYLTRRSK
jgi:hypothetical protein